MGKRTLCVNVRQPAQEVRFSVSVIAVVTHRRCCSSMVNGHGATERQSDDKDITHRTHRTLWSVDTQRTLRTRSAHADVRTRGNDGQPRANTDAASAGTHDTLPTITHPLIRAALLSHQTSTDCALSPAFIERSHCFQPRVLLVDPTD